MSGSRWDFKTIKEVVPIEEVLAMHGIYPVRGKYRLRDDDDTPSAHVYTKTNTVHDFGYHNTFDPLTLTMYLQGCDMVTASQILGEAFHVPPKYTEKDMEENANRMMYYDWPLLGVYGDLVTKNIDFDLEQFGLARSAKFAERFRMSMSELRDRALGLKEDAEGGKVEKRKENKEKASTVPADDWDRKWYETIMRKRAVPFVREKRDEYFRTMHDDYRLAMSVLDNWSMDDVFRMHKDKYEDMASSLARAEGTLRKALEGTSVKFAFRSYYPQADFARVVNGEISFGIGEHKQAEVSDAAYRDKAKVFYCVVSEQEYYRLYSHGMDSLMVAATQKGDQVSLAFSSVDAVKMNYLMKALRGKEVALAESLGEALALSQENKQISPQNKDVPQVRASEASGQKGNEVGRQGDAIKVIASRD